MCAGQKLDIPLIVTEQYPEGLGHTIAELDTAHAKANYAKTLFSMVTPEVNGKMCELFTQNPLLSVVLFGIEVNPRLFYTKWHTL